MFFYLIAFTFQTFNQGLILNILSIYNPKYTGVYIQYQPVANIFINVIKQVLFIAKVSDGFDVSHLTKKMKNNPFLVLHYFWYILRLGRLLDLPFQEIDCNWHVQIQFHGEKHWKSWGELWCCSEGGQGWGFWYFHHHVPLLLLLACYHFLLQCKLFSEILKLTCLAFDIHANWQIYLVLELRISLLRLLR